MQAKSAMEGLKLVQPKHRELSGGDLLAQCLQALGVEVAFGIHGGHLDAALIGLIDSGIRLVDTRHEQAAINAAEGYSKVKGKTGVAFVTANSGFSNSLPGLATAMADRSKIFVITSSPPLRDAETNCLQGFLDQVVASKSVTKFSHRVMEAEEIPRLVAHAWRISSSGAPGPVLIDFPIDILFRPVVQDRIGWGSIHTPLPFPPAPHPLAIKEAVSLLKDAKKPAIIIGTGCRAEETTKALSHFVETTRIPVFYSPKGVGTLPVDHDLAAGSAGNLARLAGRGKGPPDLTLLLGARTGMFLAGRSGAVLPKSGCKVIQVDTDGGEIGRSLPVHLGIVSDVALALFALSEAIGESYKASEEWTALAVSLKKTPNHHEKDAKVMPDGKLNPYLALKEVLVTLQPGSIISIDGGESGSWATGLIEYARPHISLFSAGYLGMLGNGWGYSLGAAVADPSRQVINIQGDGSAGFHIAELDTYKRHNLNILTVILNNYVWGMSIHGQEIIYKDHTPTRAISTLSPDCAFDIVAAGFANASARLDSLDEVAAKVKQLSTVEGPALLNLIVSDRPTHEGTIAMVSDTDDPSMIVVPYYENIPRPIYAPKASVGLRNKNGV